MVGIVNLLGVFLTGVVILTSTKTCLNFDIFISALNVTCCYYDVGMAIERGGEGTNLLIPIPDILLCPRSLRVPVRIT